MIMFKNPTIQIGGNSSVEGIVGAEKDIGMSHKYFVLKQN